MRTARFFFSKLVKLDAGDAVIEISVNIYKNKESNSVFKIYYVINLGEANEAARAKEISFEIGKENICKSITLHLPGEVLQPTYLPFYESFEIIKCRFLLIIEATATLHFE